MIRPNNYTEFVQTLGCSSPESDWPDALRSIWYDAKGNWKASHDIAQEIHTNTGSWIHAYLHRKEGDEFNAAYWYRRANRPFPKSTLEEEHQEIVAYIFAD